MSDITHWPEWFHIGRLVGAFVLTGWLGMHAYSLHAKERSQPVSSRRWMYWLYAAIFLAVTSAGFAQLCIATVMRQTGRIPLHLELFALAISLSYVVVVAGVSRRGRG